MNKKAFRADILLLLTAAIWGFAFVAQSSAMDYVGPFTYNAIRFSLGSLSLLPLIFFRKKKARTETPAEAIVPDGAKDRAAGRLRPFVYTFIAGTVLFVASALQQVGIMFTTVGKAGFITGFYVVLTPIFGIFLGKKTHIPTWVGMVFALIGLYFISRPESITQINPGDFLVIISAVFWACHILVIDHFVQGMDPLALSSGQFAWCALYMFAAAFVVEPLVGGWAARLAPHIPLQQWETLAGLAGSPNASAILLGAAIPVLYGGLASVGIAYTLQVIAQKDAPPAHAVIMLSLEGSFAVLGGMLLRGEKAGPFTLIGFALMLSAMFITQWDVIFAKKARPDADKQNGGA